MHMTSQKGAQLRWGSNETLPRASSPSMQPGGQTLQATPPGWPARGPRTDRLSANAHCQHNTCALRDTRLASLLWRCDPLWRQCIRSIERFHVMSCWRTNSRLLSNRTQYSFMQVSFSIIVHNGIFMLTSPFGVQVHDCVIRVGAWCARLP